MKLYKTSEKLISKNYPYGYVLKTTKTDWLEFNAKHGFRHCSMTINPKTGLENKPKKSTYYNIMVLGKDDNNYTKSTVLEFYNDESIDRILAFFSNQDNFNLFTPEQIKYVYAKFIVWVKVTIHAQAVYCGSKIDDLFPLFKSQVNILVKGLKEKGTVNYFPQITFDWEKINSFKVEGYKPFKVTTYGG